MAKTAQILLVGLPGSGKSRVQQAIREQLDLECVELGTLPDLGEPKQPHQQVWCVIDARPAFDEMQDAHALSHLAELLQLADGVLLNFIEAADLTLQSHWIKWIKAQRPLPVVRLTYGRFPQGWVGFERDTLPDALQQTAAMPTLPGLQTCRYEVKKLYLEHLLMGLDALRRNWGVRIWRVTGVFYTFEYVNPVQLEGTPFGLDTFAAAGEVPGDVPDGWLQIQGVDLPQAQLQELVDACQLSF
ncbi:hypothetical protein [Thiomicrorhabdus cannonii]|uniref:hypothetical protein n=1 Tax=Thiomicrorhabdus cannonii TaxID=2748011 RepID=UPI0015B924B3|nr:hypothetical protein [Thiomicrorhabdus cannonii]